jgi:hypothetical protein
MSLVVRSCLFESGTPDGRAESSGRRGGFTVSGGAAEHRHPARRVDRHAPRGHSAHLRDDCVAHHPHREQPQRSDSVVSQAHTELAGGVPFMSEADVRTGLDEAKVPPATAEEIVKALPFTRGIPTVQPGAQAKPRPPPE